MAFDFKRVLDRQATRATSVPPPLASPEPWVFGDLAAVIGRNWVWANHYGFTEKTSLQIWHWHRIGVKQLIAFSVCIITSFR
jgi:hypothetical protein